MTTPSLTLGPTRIDILRDGVFETTRDAFAHADGEAARAHLLEAWGDRPIRVDVNCFLLRRPGEVALVDAGTGPSWGPGLGHARAALAAAGVAPQDVDRVYLTHLHGDHGLGLLDGDAAFLPRAEVLVPEEDLAFFTDGAAAAALPESRRGGFDLATGLRAAYGARLRPIAMGALGTGVEAVALPGHTPGQAGYLLRKVSQDLFFCGDALHVAEVQAPDPDAGLVFDLDLRQAAATRRAILARAAQDGWILGGGHLAGFSRVERDGPSFRIFPAEA